MKCKTFTEIDALYVAPSTPGWQLILRAARTIITKGYSEDNFGLLISNIIARTGEYLPERHRAEIVHTVFRAVTIFPERELGDVITAFFDSQLGKIGVIQLLDGSAYEIIENDPDDDSPCEYFIRNKQAHNINEVQIQTIDNHQYFTEMIFEEPQIRVRN